MSKQHFIALADKIREHNKRALSVVGVTSAWSPFTPEQVSALADFCKESNPAFKRELWLAYVNGECGPSGGKLKGAK